MEASTSSEANFQIPAISRIPLSVPSGYEVDLAISGFTSFLQSDAGSKVGSLPLISSLDGLGKLQSVEGMTIQKAFELMNRVKPIQDLVKRIVTKAEMWNVFINSNEVKEFERQLQTGANGPEAITSSNPQTQGISYSQHQSSGANIVVTNLSTNQQTHNNLSSQLRSSGANNVVRNPSISPQLHNTVYSQQQSSALVRGKSSRKVLSLAHGKRSYWNSLGLGRRYSWHSSPSFRKMEVEVEVEVAVDVDVVEVDVNSQLTSILKWHSSFPLC